MAEGMWASGSGSVTAHSHTAPLCSGGLGRIFASFSLSFLLCEVGRLASLSRHSGALLPMRHWVHCPRAPRLSQYALPWHWYVYRLFPALTHGAKEGKGEGEPSAVLPGLWRRYKPHMPTRLVSLVTAGHFLLRACLQEMHLSHTIVFKSKTKAE